MVIRTTMAFTQTKSTLGGGHTYNVSAVGLAMLLSPIKSPEGYSSAHAIAHSSYR